MSRIFSTGTMIADGATEREARIVSVQGGYDPRLRTGYLVVHEGTECQFNSQLDPETATLKLTFERLTALADERRIFASNRFWSELYDDIEGEVAEGNREV